MTSRSERSISCASCQTVNDQGEVFCRECGAPIVSPPISNPEQLKEAEVSLPLKAREKRPKLVVVLGLWLLLFPTLILSAYVALDIATSYRNRSSFIPFWLVVGLCLILAISLYRITRNYLTIPAMGKDVEGEVEE